MGMIVVEDFTEPQVMFNVDAGTPGHYACLDRLNRVDNYWWHDYGADTIRDRCVYGHDRASNRVFRESTNGLGMDEFYTYDEVNRLANFDRGDLNAGKTAIMGTPVREEDWSLDATGNWSNFVQKTSGTTDLDQDRTHNKVNEIIDITETTGTAWVTPVEDRNGNLTAVPKPSSLASGLTLTYDAWNRLTEVKDGATVVARYEYDGQNRRIKKHLDSQSPDAPDGLDTYVHYFYNSSWQILETRQTTTESDQPENLQPKYQHVWSLRYIDSPILRDENTDVDWLCNDHRFYYLNDANFNVTSLIDTSGDGIERYQYDPYGKVTIYDGSWSSTRSTSSYNNVILYAGRELDPESGLYHYRNRYYSTELGRFISRDPIEYEGSQWNLDEYVHNNPVQFTDPLGLGLEYTWEDKLFRMDSLKGKFGKVRGQTEAKWKRHDTRCEQMKDEPKCFCSELNFHLHVRTASLKPSSPQYNWRNSQFDVEWGNPRTNLQEAAIVGLHEMDHTMTFLAFFVFSVLQVESADGRCFLKKATCENFNNCVATHLLELFRKAELHSASFDSRPWNYGGAYKKHPFTDKLDLAPCYKGLPRDCCSNRVVTRETP